MAINKRKFYTPSTENQKNSLIKLHLIFFVSQVWIVRSKQGLSIESPDWQSIYIIIF
jgi:hypothetical protein